MIGNRCNISGVDGVSTPKNGGKTYASCASRMMQFSIRFLIEWIPPSTQKILQ